MEKYPIIIDPTTLKIEGTPYHIDDLIIASYDRLLPRVIKEVMDLGVDTTANEVAEIAKGVFDKFLPFLRDDVRDAITHCQRIDYAIADIFDKRAAIILPPLIMMIGNVDVNPDQLRIYITLIFEKLFNDIHNEVKTKRASIDEYFSVIKGGKQ